MSDTTTTEDKPTKTIKEHFFGDSKILWVIAFLIGTFTGNMDRLVTMVVPDLSQHFVPRTEYLEDQQETNQRLDQLTEKVEKLNG